MKVVEGNPGLILFTSRYSKALLVDRLSVYSQTVFKAIFHYKLRNVNACAKADLLGPF